MNGMQHQQQYGGNNGGMMNQGMQHQYGMNNGMNMNQNQQQQQYMNMNGGQQQQQMQMQMQNQNNMKDDDAIKMLESLRGISPENLEYNPYVGNSG